MLSQFLAELAAGSAFKRSPARWDACRSIANAAMAKKTKAKAPAKKPTAAKPKATSKSSSGGAVVEVEACKRSASGVLL